MTRHHTLGISSVLAITYCLFAMPANAQLVDPVGERASLSENGSGEIIVTARKRDERLQDVPLSIAVIDSGVIERQGARSLADIARLTPGLQFSSNFGPDDIRPTLRGISTVRGRPSVAILEDGIDSNGASIATSGGSSLMNVRLLDLERVEVVRGPQSVTYGRNAFAGAINYVTKGPTDTFQAGASADFATYDQVDLAGFISGPLSDTLRYRLNAGFHHFNGFYDNAITGKNVGEERSAGLRAQLEWTPSNPLKVLLRYSFSRDRNAQQPQVLMLANATGASNFRYVAGPVNADESNLTLFGDLPGLTSHTHKGSIDVSYDLGDAIFTSTSYGLIWNAKQVFDGAFGQPTGLPAGFSLRTIFDTKMKTKQFSQEFRLSSKGSSRLQYTVGGYYLFENAELIDQSQSFFASCANPLVNARAGIGCSPGLNQYLGPDLSDPNMFPNSFEKRRTNHFSVYASLGYELLDGLHMTAEARYAHETIDVSHSPLSRLLAQLGFASTTGGPFTSALFLPTGGYRLPPTESASTTINYFNPRLSVNYKIDPRMMLYASFAKGTKPGGFSQIINLERYDINRYDPEKLYSYELGLKVNTDNRVLVLDVAGFYSIYRDQQVNFNTIQVVNGVNFSRAGVTNAGRVKTYGLEVQAALHPLKQLDINASYAYTISKYTNFISIDTAAIRLFPGGDLSGNALPDVPKNAWTLVTRWHDKLTDNIGWSAEVTQSYVGKRFIISDSTNTSFLRPINQTDANIGLDFGGWSITGYVRNLFENYRPRNAFRGNNLASATAADQAVIVTLPALRQFGMRANVRF